MKSIFHLAIPCKDLDEAERFYTQLGCLVARRMKDRITLKFYEDQVVCHLAPEKIDSEPSMYPRHFGRTFIKESDFEECLQRARESNLTFFSEPATRFEGREDEHRMFFLKDPSNNLLEFKYYYNTEMIY